MAGGDALDHLARGPVDPGVGPRRGQVGVAPLADEIDPVHPQRRAGAGVLEAGLDPLALGAGGEDRLGVVGVGREGDKSCAVIFIRA
mgnify:CR=1 FL=1